ncbi:DNA ligase [compost metagenome]
MYEAGIINSYLDCVIIASRDVQDHMDEFEEAGFTKNGVIRIHSAFAKQMAKLDINAAMIGVGSFAEGVGERRLEQINKVISSGQLLQMSKELSVADFTEALAQVDGIGEVVGRQIAEGLKEFRRLHLPALQKYTEVVIPKRTTKAARPKKGKWRGVRATWTGYRSKEQEEQFVANGGEIVSFGSKTTVLFYKDGGKTSSKVEKAEAKGITVTTWEQFV